MYRLLRRLIGTFVLLACGSATCFAEGACAEKAEQHPREAEDVKVVCVVNQGKRSVPTATSAAINKCGGHADNYGHDQDWPQVCELVGAYYPSVRRDGSWTYSGPTFGDSACAAVVVAFDAEADPNGPGRNWSTYEAMASNQSEAESGALAVCKQALHQPTKQKCGPVVASVCDTMPKPSDR